MRFTVFLAAVLILAAAGPAQATTCVYIVVASGGHTIYDPGQATPANLTTFAKGDIAEYNIDTNTATMYLRAPDLFYTNGTGGIHVSSDTSETFDAVDILPNRFGSYDGVLVSTASEAWLSKAGGGYLHIRAGDLALVNKATMEASLFLVGNATTAGENPGFFDVFRSGPTGSSNSTANIDAVEYLDDLTILFSTGADFNKVGANLLPVLNGDVVKYALDTHVASIYFGENRFRKDNGQYGANTNVDGVAVLGEDGKLYLSTNAAGRLGGHNANPGTDILSFTAGDIVKYDLALDEASLLNGFNHTYVHCSNSADINDFAIVSVKGGGGAPVPEPVTMLGVFGAAAGIGAYLRRRGKTRQS